jgi:hypothetical protein
MAVTFSPAVPSNPNSFSNSATFTLTMSGVVSGQPIIIAGYDGYCDFNGLSPSFSDNFATPYTYTPVVEAFNTNSPSSVALYIATGGAGTSGTITLTINPYCYNFLYAVACSGASTLNGANAIDQSGILLSNGTTQNSPSLTPTYANEGAVYTLVSLGETVSSSPGSPWVVSSQPGFASIATYSNPTNGSALSTSWVTTPTIQYATAGLIIHAAGYTPPTSGLMASLI